MPSVPMAVPAVRGGTAATDRVPTVKVYEAINAVQAALSKDGIAKTRKNLQQGYSFRGIDEVMNALSPVLAAARLCILPRVLTRETTERPSKSGGTLFSTILEIEFDFVHSEDGSTHTVRVVGEAMDSADKSCNKAMSAGYKYACMQAFCIPTEGDNDADAVTHEPVTARPPAPPEKRENLSAANRGELAASPIPREPGDDDDELPGGALLVTSVQTQPTKNPNVQKALINFSDGRVRSTINTLLINTATQCQAERVPVWVQDKQTKWGFDLVTLSLEALG